MLSGFFISTQTGSLPLLKVVALLISYVWGLFFENFV